MYNILLTGSSGYIASNIRYILQDYKVYNVDKVEKDMPNFFHGDFTDALSHISEKIDCVIHLAADKAIAQAEIDPVTCYYNNCVKLNILLQQMTERNINKIIFASSASVYQENISKLCETDTLNPHSVYGKSKLLAEELIENWCKKDSNRQAIIFRFFNVVGGFTNCKDNSLLNVIPVLDRCVKNNNPFYIYGTNYNTNDGTAIRDYVDVRDIAQAHILALNYNTKGVHIFNLGNNYGISVKELVEKYIQIRQCKLTIILSSQRPGDVAKSVADSTKAHNILGFKCEYNIVDSLTL